MGSHDPFDLEWTCPLPIELPTLAEKLAETAPSRLARFFKNRFFKALDQRLRSSGYILDYESFERWRDDLQHLPWSTIVTGEGELTPQGVMSKMRELLLSSSESNHSPVIPGPWKNTRKASTFSLEPRQYFVEGDVNGTPVEALPDSGADMCFISPKLASHIGLRPASWTQKKIQLANKKCIQSPGMVEVAWRFAKEQKPHILNCWILPGCVHDIVLGSHFLNATKTLTTFKNRIRSKLVDLPRRLRLRLLGEEKQRLWGYLDGHLTAALPDTGSDVMFISSTYARNIGLLIDRDFEELLEVEFADGTTAWTSGVIRDVPWEVGGTTVRCDFHVLDALCVDVVLSKNYLFDLNVFSESSEYFFSVDSEDDLFQLFNIRLIGRYGATLNILEEEYLQDMASPDAFGPESVQRELARRDQIRDEILALDENKRKAATQAEAERQRRWEDLRQAHQTRWITASSAGLPPEELSGNDLQGATTRSGFWKKKAGDAVQSLVDQLLTGLSNEGAVLGQTYNQLRDLASNFSSLSVGDVLKRLAVILADGVLSSAQVVVDALLDVLQRVAESAIDLLHTKMHIPIISDILNAIGVPDISFLDLFTWIAAVGYTVVYKIANDEAPFPDTSEVSAIISASTWDDLSSLFHPKSAKKVNSIVRRAPVSASITLPEAMQSALFIASHATAGFMLFVGDIMGSLEAEVITGENPFSIPSAVLGVIVAAFEGGGNALVPKAPIDNTAVSVISDVTTAAVIVSKIVFSGPVQSRLGASGSKFPGLAVDDGRATGAIVNSVLIFPALFVTGWHFYELSAKPEGAERSAAIVGEMSNLTSYISRVSYAVAVNDMDPTTRQIPIGVMAVSNLVDAGLQTAEAIIH